MHFHRSPENVMDEKKRMRYHTAFSPLYIQVCAVFGGKGGNPLFWGSWRGWGLIIHMEDGNPYIIIIYIIIWKKKAFVNISIFISYQNLIYIYIYFLKGGNSFRKKNGGWGGGHG